MRKPKISAFTLIELLATLTIMAIISGILFPFVANYTGKARKDSNMRSLRVFEDAMDRYRALNITMDETRWGSSAGFTVDEYYKLSTNYTENVIDDITDPGATQTLRLPGQSLTYRNVIIIRTGPAPNWEWEVMRYRDKDDRAGVDRKGNYIEENDFLSVNSGDIKDAFDYDD